MIATRAVKINERKTTRAFTAVPIENFRLRRKVQSQAWRDATPFLLPFVGFHHRHQ
mgnify:CR=1 FL=1